MNEIRELDQITVDKIAAGEVVERPAGAVKELVENALDSGATLITIEIVNGGIDMIRVSDNGSGIPVSEVRKAFTRHATSKIRSIDDLSTLNSLGIRGEALSSIAAVSRVEMITKTADTITGTRYVMEGGAEVLCEETGAPDGTCVIVHDLFYNTPARAKFLKTPKTEASYVAEFAECFALAHPECAFTFISDKKDRFHTSGNGDQKENIFRIYGKDVSSNVVQTGFSDERMKVTGYLGKPFVNRSNRSQEYFFVNGRHVKDRMLSAAVEEGYRGFLMQHRFPFVILNIEISPDEIDVNVHPTKMEIRFNRPRDIAALVIRSLRDALMGLELIPDTLSDGSAADEEPRTSHKTRGVPVHNAGRKPFKMVYDMQPEIKTSSQQAFELTLEEAGSRYGQSSESTAQQQGREIITAGGRTDIRVIGQLFDTFWIMQWQDKLLIMDQHAAHEKVNYERMMKRFRERSVMSQLIDPPVILELSAREYDLLEDNMDAFISLGFELEPFGQRTVSLRGVPLDIYGASDEREMFLNILDELSQDQSNDRDPAAITGRIAGMACKASVKGNTRLDPSEAETLLDELLTLENPYNCPHGRPTIITMTRYELEKRFGRVVG